MWHLGVTCGDDISRIWSPRPSPGRHQRHRDHREQPTITSAATAPAAIRAFCFSVVSPGSRIAFSLLRGIDDSRIGAGHGEQVVDHLKHCRGSAKTLRQSGGVMCGAMEQEFTDPATEATLLQT